jgi:hypothetical protein
VHPDAECASGAATLGAIAPGGQSAASAAMDGGGGRRALAANRWAAATQAPSAG